MSCYVHDGFFLPYVSRPRQRKLASPSKYGVSKVLTFKRGAELGEKRFYSLCGRRPKGRKGRKRGEEKVNFWVNLITDTSSLSVNFSSYDGWLEDLPFPIPQVCIVISVQFADCSSSI